MSNKKESGICTLGHILRELRSDNNLSQEKISEMIFVSRSSYSHYENNTRIPAIDTLVRLALFYDTGITRFVLPFLSYNELITILQNEADWYQNELSHFSPQEIILIETYRRLSDSNKEVLFSIIKSINMINEE